MNRFPDRTLLEELDLTILGRRAWVNRARLGEIKRPPEVVQRAAGRLAALEAAAERLHELTMGHLGHVK